jgi:tRNA (mo5U34)-methyltransferase
VNNPYRLLQEAGRPALADLGWSFLQSSTHGDLATWLHAIDALPEGQHVADLDRDAPALGKSTANPEVLRENLFSLHPWRKGPLQLAGVDIDTEWRSDWKWDRIRDHLELEGLDILDIGCGNGYFGLRMLGAGAKLVVGIDPTMVFVMQWLAMQKLCPGLNNYVLPLGIEHLPVGIDHFDCVFSMGVLYHRRDPLEHLQQLKKLVRPGGSIVLETLILDGAGNKTLLPGGRYARMRNVHAVPGLEVLLGWLDQAGLPDFQVMDVSRTTVDEQRTTEWMTFESLCESLDTHDPSLTVEGHPAPVRAAVLIQV